MICAVFEMGLVASQNENRRRIGSAREIST
jgi:hypothetical protein